MKNKKSLILIGINKMATEYISDELKYSPEVSNHSTVVYRKISPQSAATLTLGVGTLGPTEFLIPPSVFNMSKSILQFNAQFTAATSAGNFANFISANGLSFISRITLYDTATNAVWADINNVSQYAAQVVPAGTDMQTFLTKPTLVTPGTTIAAAALLPVEDISKCNAATALTVDMAGTALVTLANAYVGRRQFYIGAANTATDFTVNIPMSAFKFSALATRKQLYCPSNLVLQVYWNTLNSIGFGAAAVGTPQTTPEALSGGTISTPVLILANEGNLNIVSQVIDKTMKSGITLPIGYPTVTRQTVTGTSPSYSLNLTRGYGDRILAVVTSPFSLVATRLNIHARGELTQYNTFINNVALKYPAGFNCSASEDYAIANRLYLKDSVVQTLEEYANAEWVHIDSFFGEKPLKDVDQHQVDGLDVGTQSSTWQFVGTRSGAALDYSFVSTIIGQKILSITNQGSSIA